MSNYILPTAYGAFESPYDHHQRARLLLLRLPSTCGLLTQTMEVFYGPHHERPSGLCLVTGALTQSRETIARGLLVSEIQAYVLERYPWSSKPVEKKKGRKTSSGDEATNLVNEGIVAGVKNQIFRTNSDGAETKVFTTPKLRQMFPDSKWVRKRARESLKEDARAEDRATAERLDTPQETAPPSAEPEAKQEAPKGVQRPQEDASTDVSHAVDAVPASQSAEAQAEVAHPREGESPKPDPPETTSGDPVLADGKPASQSDSEDQLAVLEQLGGEHSPPDGAAATALPLQLSEREETRPGPPPGLQSNVRSGEGAHAVDPASEAADGAQLPDKERGELATEATDTVGSRRRRPSPAAEATAHKRQRTSSSQPPPRLG